MSCDRFAFLLLMSLVSVADAAPPTLEFMVSKQWLAGKLQKVASLLPAKGDYPRSIALQVDPGALPAGKAFPLGVGIPLREGQLKDLKKVAIEGQRQGSLPAVAEARATWSDRSVKWLWVDFEGAVDDHYRLRCDGPATARPEGNVVRQDARQLTVLNQRLEVHWDRQAAFPTLVRFAGNQQAVAAGDGQGVYLIDNQGRRATLAGKQAELAWKVETDHPLRTVVRVEGWYVTADGQRLARAVLRYHLYRQMPWIRVEHTFVVTEDNDQVWYREIGLRVPAPPGPRIAARFGLQSGKPLTVDDFQREAYLFQKTYPLYAKRDSQCLVGSDERVVGQGAAAAGWGDVSGPDGGLLVAVKDFAPQFPKEIAVGSGAVDVKLWSGRGGLELDYKPQTLAQDWWGAWLDRLPFSSAARAAKGQAWHTPDEVRKLNPSPVGAARTHELCLVWYQGPSVPQRAELLEALVQHPAVVQPDPAWICHVDPRIVPPLIARSEVAPRYRDLERMYSAWLDGNLRPLEVFPMTGWYEWGKHADLRYEKTPDGTVYAQWYRLRNLNYYYYNRNLLYTWLRTGERQFLDVAQRTNRFLADGYCHWSGGRDKKIAGYESAGDAHLPIYWHGGVLTTDASKEALSALVMDYYLCDQRRYRDLAELVHRAFAENFKPVYLRTADERVRTMIAVLELFPDEKLDQAMRSYMRLLLDPGDSTGLNLKYWKDEAGALYKVHRKCFNAIEYQNFTQEDWLFPCIVKMALACMGRYGESYEQPFSYQNYSPAIAGRLYQITHDPDWLAWAQYQFDAALEIFRQYDKLPAAEKGAGYFVRYVTPPGTASGSGRYPFPVSFLKDPKQKGVLCFDGDIGPLLVSFPFGMQALQSAPPRK